MTVPGPVRSGFRIAGADAAQATYAHPPLVESWLGVEFDGQGLGVEDFAGLRSALGPEWPGDWKPASSSSEGSLLITNVMGDRALQVHDRGFTFGWLGYSGERYPRYETVRDGFVAVLDTLRSLPGRERSELTPRRWWVLYKNRIPRGTVWSTPGDWSFFNLWQPAAIKGLDVDPSGFKAQWEFELDAERGRLTIEFQHQESVSSDEPESVWLNLTAAGVIESPDASLFDGMDFGREVIVRSFNELVSPEAKEFWGVRAR